MSAFSPSQRAALSLILAAASWGLGTVISKHAVTEIPPLLLLTIQLAASLAVLALVMLARRGGSFRSAISSPLGALGVLNPGIAYALSLFGLVYVSASLSVVLWALEPVLILLLAGWLLGERVGPKLLLLSLAAIAGVLVVIGGPGTQPVHLLGVALTVAGVGCCAVYTVVARRLIAGADSTLAVVAAQEAYALAFAVVVLVGTSIGGQPWLVAITPFGWASAIGSGVLYYGLAYWLYLSGLRQVPASTAAAAFYLIPVFGVAGGFAVLGERFTAAQWAGAAIAVLAVAVILRRASATPTPAAARA